MAAKPSIRVTFCGAAETVTGSKFLVEIGDKKVLIDCGLFQGRKELRERNWKEPIFDPEKLDAIILTHAHIDHTGYLPLVVRRGYRGPVYCTAPTKELLHLLLPDSAHLQEEQAAYMNKHKTSKHSPAKPLYTSADAIQALSQLKVIERDKVNPIFQGVTVTPHCAGHILGSTMLNLDAHGKRITFSGDIGQYNTPILPDPASIDIGDMLLCEATYGNRSHPDVDPREDLTAIIQGAVDRGGPIIIPAFAVGRTQNLLYYIAELEREGKIPGLPVFIDSPMAVDATNIYRKFRHDYDEEASQLLLENKLPLSTARTKLCKSVEDSKRLNDLKGPRIIISASGMITGGRILHHMLRWLDREETTVLFVGYQAPGTRGHYIQQKKGDAKIFGKRIPIRADIQNISGLSAHGDRDDLLNWLGTCNHNPKKVMIIHGEADSSRAFAGSIKKNLKWDAEVAKYRQTVEV